MTATISQQEWEEYQDLKFKERKRAGLLRSARAILKNELDYDSKKKRMKGLIPARIVASFLFDLEHVTEEKAPDFLEAWKSVVSRTIE